MSRSAQPSHRVPGCLSKAEYSLQKSVGHGQPGTHPCIPVFNRELRRLHSQLLPCKVLQALNVHEVFSTGLSQVNGQSALLAM